jgi:hypothetical protein
MLITHVTFLNSGLSDSSSDKSLGLIQHVSGSYFVCSVFLSTVCLTIHFLRNLPKFKGPVENLIIFLQIFPLPYLKIDRIACFCIELLIA